MARHTVTTAALAATTALLLTACGGNDDTPPDDIKGADRASSASPSAAASASAGGEGPDLSLPKDVDLVFDFDKPSDVKHEAALADAKNYLRAMYHGIVAQDPDDPAYRYYSGGQAAQYVKSQIEAAVKGGWTPSGTEKYYDEDVTTLSDGKRTLVTFCSNQSKIFSKDIKSGEINRTEESLSSYLKFRLLMLPPSGSSQVWKAQVSEVVSKAKECRA
ncbi:hypothetical protein C6Y14_34995 [Streptomyces dioscori]|uniref:Lipoprotein n=1 Tax=Streptomyces dioscori TaxID=2109333 RepID=A0A2P8PXR6_9ACTN|nr:hypothetical protein [Streptomyces dioscori]PSM38784.1 hypothetical protein C6Y14_34995 [Streptomyces dioscori]